MVVGPAPAGDEIGDVAGLAVMVLWAVPVIDARFGADLVAQRGSNIWFELDDAALATEVGLPPGTTKGTDTIDVWIDSGISHKAVCAVHPELRDPADKPTKDTHRSRGQGMILRGIDPDPS